MQAETRARFLAHLARRQVAGETQHVEPLQMGAEGARLAQSRGRGPSPIGREAFAQEEEPAQAR
jgi:hypothetical protein